METILKDFANWLWDMDRLRINSQIPGIRSANEIVDTYLKDASIHVECEHPFKRLHWVDGVVFCNKCKKTLHK